MTQRLRHYWVLAMLVGIGVFLVLPFRSEAALLYIDPSTASINRGDSITVAVRLDTDEGECVNTVDAVIRYDDAIKAVDVSRGDSILNIWVEDPVIDDEENTITFAGGIPGGYCGRIPGDPRLTNIVAELVFRSPGLTIGGNPAAEAKVWFSDVTQVLLHDGFGTKASLRTTGSTIGLLKDAGQRTDDAWRLRVQDDDTPPADFSVALTREDGAFNNQYFIVFNTQDKQSGIDHYEVMEEPFDEFHLFKWGAQDAPWVTAESPYIVQDQTLNSSIHVKAIDKAGNETVVILVPDVALRTLSIQRWLTFGTIGLIVVMVAGLVGYALWRRKQSLISDYNENDDSGE